MKKRIINLLSFVMFASALWAQSNLSEINRIKRDKDYLYGEATLESKDAALKLAYELLEVEIKNWASGKNSKISSVTAMKVYEYADTILLRRHNMVRAFVYVKTSNLKAIKGKTLNVDLDRDKPLSKPIGQPAKESVPAPMEEKHPVMEPEVVEAAPVVPVAKQKTIADEVLERVMEENTFNDLEKVIKPLKAEGKITDYGKYPTMTDPANCYLIVYDRQAQIRAFLDKGVDKRRNLKTGLEDSEKNYHGCGAIWMKIKEQK